MLRTLGRLLLISVVFSNLLFSDVSIAGTCGQLAQPTADFSFLFESNREHLIIPLTLDPEPFFLSASHTEGKGEMYLHREPRLLSPPLLFKVENFFSNKTTAPGPFDFRIALRPGFRYTFILSKSELIFGRIPNEGREQFSKHLVLSKHARVLMAGEMWIGDDGLLSIANASGSYKPGTLRLHRLVQFLESQFSFTRIKLFSIGDDGSYQPINK